MSRVERRLLSKKAFVVKKRKEIVKKIFMFFEIFKLFLSLKEKRRTKKTKISIMLKVGIT